MVIIEIYTSAVTPPDREPFKVYATIPAKDVERFVHEMERRDIPVTQNALNDAINVYGGLVNNPKIRAFSTEEFEAMPKTGYIDKSQPKYN